MSSSNSEDRPIYDPLKLYGQNSEERKNERIQPLELDRTEINKPVLDPLNLYQDKSQVTLNADMSASLPFLPRPAMLTGELAGDLGFDPLGFASTPESLDFQRRAELKHARLAMLAAVGWPLSELVQKAWSAVPDASEHVEQSLLNVGDRVPSVLNGGLDKVSPLFWVSALALAGIIEAFASYYRQQGEELVFDPLGLYPRDNEKMKKFVETAETFNGRLAMLAIVGFAFQEFVTQMGVVNETPFFFHSALW
ncbi:hypothetical protein ACA910_007742 [Epithemia clementina (nom. ined.)]